MARDSRTKAGQRGGFRPPGSLALLLALLAAAAPALAANLGPHGQGGANPCRICHNTASATPALRGWAGTGAGPTTGTWTAKTISSLCYMCHESGGGGFGASNQTANAYAAGSHQFLPSRVPEGPGGTLMTVPTTASGLPYAASGELECTTCHNVHAVAGRPFMAKASIDALCGTCHPGRVNDAEVPVRTTALSGEVREYSTHPTAQPLGDQNRANVKAFDGLDGRLKVAVAGVWSTADSWALGGHITGGATGTFSCQTCHAVHGPESGTPGLKNLLAIENDNVAGGTNPAALCEGCHFGGDAGEQVGSVVIQAALLVGSYSDHPIDSLGNRAFYPSGVALPTQWQGANPNRDSGATAMYGTAGIGKPTCQSCHDAHGGIAGTPLLRGPQPSSTWEPLSYDDWCFACHTAAQVLPAAHHSVINNLSPALGDAIESQLSCGDCHGPAGTTSWSAHNGFWSWAVPVAATDSLLCEACHTAVNPKDLVAPALKGQTFVEPALFPSTHGTVRGSGSHYLGPDSDEFLGVVPKTTAWSSTYFSSYGPPNTGGGGSVAPLGTGAIICGSCHNVLYNDGKWNPESYQPPPPDALTPVKAGWRSNLLLERYEDDSTGTGDGAGPYAVGSALCTGCHGDAGYHHPLTGDLLTTGWRTGLALATGAGSYADQTVAPVGGGAAPGTLSYPALNQLDCDSCHRPHEADDDSDVADALHGSSTSTDGRPTRHILEVDGLGHLYTPDLCAECHAR